MVAIVCWLGAWRLHLGTRAPSPLLGIGIRRLTFHTTPPPAGDNFNLLRCGSLSFAVSTFGGNVGKVVFRHLVLGFRSLDTW